MAKALWYPRRIPPAVLYPHMPATSTDTLPLSPKRECAVECMPISSIECVLWSSACHLYPVHGPQTDVDVLQLWP
jgi:hypothetical protein